VRFKENDTLMINPFLFQLLTLTLPNTTIPVEHYSFQNALNQNKVSAYCNYQAGRKNHERLIITATNQTKKPVKIGIPAGTYYEASVSNWQDHIITKSDSVLLPPLSRKSISMTAFCCESHDAGPKRGGRFFLKENPEPKSLELCNILDSLNIMNYSAQTAVWALFSDRETSAIYGADSSTVMTLRTYLGGVLNKPIIPFNRGVYVKRVRVSGGSTNNVRTRLSPPPPTFHCGNQMKVDSISASDDIHLSLYSFETEEEVGKIAQESILLKGKNLSRYIYNISLPQMVADEVYLVRLMRNGVVFKEWMYETV